MSNKPVAFKILTSVLYSKLEELVNEALADNWEFRGPMLIENRGKSYQSHYLQPMIKREKFILSELTERSLK
jgi:hypothetical protein